MKNRPLYISLAGGLGNQLFQLAAGLYFQTNSDVVLVDCFGAPRKNSEHRPELLSFVLPPTVTYRKIKHNNLITMRTVNWVLRMSLNENPVSRILLAPIRFLSSFATSKTLKKIVLVKTSNGVGYFGKFRAHKGQLLVGYFQSYIWASQKKVYEKLMELEPLESNPAFETLVAIAKAKRPIVLHIRRGDYRQENDIGLVGRDYYLAALSLLSKNIITDEVWVFSDEPDAAREILSTDSQFKFRFVTETQESAALTFQLMRYGSAYIIANSTFSWWSAFLRFDKDASVIAPNPWFLNAKEPSELVPKNWISLQRETSQEEIC